MSEKQIVSDEPWSAPTRAEKSVIDRYLAVIDRARAAIFVRPGWEERHLTLISCSPSSPVVRFPLFSPVGWGFWLGS